MMVPRQCSSAWSFRPAVRLDFSAFSTTTRQAELKPSIFCTRQSLTCSASGIEALHSRTASGVQASLCSIVPSATTGEAAKASAAPSKQIAIGRGRGESCVSMFNSTHPAIPDRGFWPRVFGQELLAMSSTDYGESPGCRPGSGIAFTSRPERRVNFRRAR
jgi:hypothetical protein